MKDQWVVKRPDRPYNDSLSSPLPFLVNDSRPDRNVMWALMFLVQHEWRGTHLLQWPGVTVTVATTVTLFLGSGKSRVQVRERERTTTGIGIFSF